MARPRIGIFGALVAVGGVIAWRWSQKHRASQARLAGELSRWEGEGGALASVTQAAPSAPVSAPAMPGGAMHDEAGHVGSTPDAWVFPHS